MNRRLLIFAIGGLELVVCAVSVRRAFDAYANPSPAWMMGRRWYEEGINAALNAVIAGACVAYFCRRTFGRRRGADEMAKAEGKPRRWRDKSELRVVVYCLAACLILTLPINVLKAVQALGSRPPPWADSFWSLLPIDTFIGPLVGVGLIAYDRRRVRREVLLDAGQCHVCGYDLRATPDRCPECGSAPVTKRPAPRVI